MLQLIGRAAIAIRAPTSAFASPAYHGMTIVCDISAAARAGCRAKKGLPILLRLQKRAAEALVAAGKSPSLARAVPVDHDDDLSHLHTSAKLRRVGSSPPSKKTSPVNLERTPPPLESHLSPTSPRSVATSATLAEPVHYDASGGLIPMSSLANGAVPPPPNLTAFPPGTSTWLNLSPLEQSNPAQPFTFSWPINDFSPDGLQRGGSDSSNHMFGITEIDLSLGRDPSTSGPVGLGMTFGEVAAPVQPLFGSNEFSGCNDATPQQGHFVHNANVINLASPQYGGYHGHAQQSSCGAQGQGQGQGHGHVQDAQQGQFHEHEHQHGIFQMDGIDIDIDKMDWEMFVSQMAVGEVGLDGNWQ